MDTEKARRLLAQGKPVAKVAQMVGVSRARVYQAFPRNHKRNVVADYIRAHPGAHASVIAAATKTPIETVRSALHRHRPPTGTPEEQAKIMVLNGANVNAAAGRTGIPVPVLLTWSRTIIRV